MRTKIDPGVPATDIAHADFLDSNTLNATGANMELILMLTEYYGIERVNRNVYLTLSHFLQSIYGIAPLHGHTDRIGEVLCGNNVEELAQ